MSPGISVSDTEVLADLAWTTVEGTRKACGEDSEITKGITRSYRILDNLHSEVSDTDSVLNSAKGGRRKDLDIHMRSCRRHLRRINSILAKHDTLRGGSGQPWQHIQLEIGAVKDMSKSQLKLSKYTSAISLTLQLLSLGPQGKMEKKLSHLHGEAKGLRVSINLLLAKQKMDSREGAGDGLIPANHQDEKELWSGFWRQLAREGFKSNAISGHKTLIKAYVKELDERGVLDEKTLRAQPTAHFSPDFDQTESDSSISTTSSRYYQSTVEDFDNLSIDEEPQSEGPTKQSFTSFDEPIHVSATQPEIFAPRAIRPPPTTHSSERSSTPPPKQKFTLSVLLFPSKRKSKRVAPIAAHSPQPRKRHRRAPPPPRPISPTPPPPAWWLEERLRRRPPGFERGRSPPPPPTPTPSPPPPLHYPINLVYSRTIAAYPDPNHYGQLVYELE
ncbi:hypothetical protein IFR05_009303 [Cadophora sp. M221]|nr:hypothetical protein IFR05_009303 [Cadophora sp. M221]